MVDIDYKPENNFFSWETLYYDDERKRFYRGGRMPGNMMNRTFAYFDQQRPDYYGVQYKNYVGAATYMDLTLRQMQKMRIQGTNAFHRSFRNISMTRGLVLNPLLCCAVAKLRGLHAEKGLYQPADILQATVALGRQRAHEPVVRY